MLASKPAFTAVAVLTLALGIGANTAIFSFLDAALNLHYPIKDQQQVANLWAFNTATGATRSGLSIPDFLDYGQQSHSFEDLAAYSEQDFQLTGVAEPKRVSGLLVSCNYFQVLGVQPSIGRYFSPKECEPGAPKVVILSHGLWQTSFGADPGILGRNTTLNRESFTVIGVMAEPGEDGLWVPLNLGSSALSRGVRQVMVRGRLKAGIRKPQAQADVNNIAHRLAQAYPATNKGWEVQVVSLQEEINKRLGLGLVFIMGPVILVLLIACANVANLLLARASVREKEMAVRVAMGARRGRLIRQLLTESALLGLAGGALGLLFGSWGMAILKALFAGTMPASVGVPHMQLRVLGFALLLCVLAPLIFGLAPALAASKLDLNETLKEGRRGSYGPRASHRLREYLVVLEVGLAIVLLGLGGLLIRAMMVLGNANDRADPKSLLTMTVSLPAGGYPHESDLAAFYHRALENAQTIPGVESAGITDRLPVIAEDRGALRPISLERQRGAVARDFAVIAKVSSGYFGALRIPLSRGRALTEQDTAGAPRVAVINGALARSWQGESPIGRRLRLEGQGREQPWITVVGVVGDVITDVRNGPLPGVYLSYAQSPEPEMTFVLRALTPPRGLAEPLKRAVWAVDKDLPAGDVRTQEQRRSEELAGPYAMVKMLVAFAALALMLASAGVYSVTSYVVSQRTQEFGIRMSLGARPGDVLKMVVREVITLVAGGLTVGLAGAFGFGHLLGHELMGIRFYDPIVFSSVSAFLLSVGLLAAYIPARRATKVDPMAALRQQ
jgi:putative ABC transport system permease protein